MAVFDPAGWLARHGTFAAGSGYEWDYDAVIPAHDPRELAAALMAFSAGQPGKPATLALDAIRGAVAWVAELAGDASNARPRAAGGAEWLAAFTDRVLEEPAFVHRAALAYNPPVPLGDQYALDRRSDAYLARNRQPQLDRVEDLVTEVLRDPGRPAADAERLWWPLTGGSLGIASQLVRAAEIAAFHPQDQRRRPAVRALRRHLVEGAHDALIAGVPFWARAWMVEHLALVDRRLLEDLISHEQEPWLKLQMRFELALPIEQRHARRASWLS